MFKKIKLMFQTKENLELTNKELMQKNLEQGNTIKDLEQLINYLKLALKEKDEVIKIANETIEDLEKKLKKATTKKATVKKETKSTKKLQKNKKGSEK